jgi:hypothetical protein
MEGFWLGVAFALPVYWIADHLVIPYIVDELRAVHVRAGRHGRR